MKPTDIRNQTWADIQKRLSGLRLAVYHALRKHGPATTRELAERSNIDLLTVRPRVTELCQMGLAELVERPGHEGHYRSVPLDTAQARFYDSQRNDATQLPLF